MSLSGQRRVVRKVGETVAAGDVIASVGDRAEKTTDGALLRGAARRDRQPRKMDAAR